MTVASTTNRKEYAMDAVTTSFATSPVVFYDTSDLVVQVVTEATGAATTLTENTHYTVTGGDGSTGTVDTSGGSSPYGAGSSAYTLVILRELPLTQPVDLAQNDGSDAEVQERAYDRLTMMVQQLDEVDERAIKLASSETATTALTELPFDRASKFLAFDSSKNLIASSGTVDGAIPVSTFMETVLDDADAATARGTLVAAGSGVITGSGLTMTTARLLGRTTASTGAVEEITVGASLTLSAGALSVTTPAVAAASQAEQEAGTEAAKYVAPATQQFHPSAIKAEMNFNGTGTAAARNSYNCTLTDNSTGDYTITIGTDFSSASWTPIIVHPLISTSANQAIQFTSQAAGSIRFVTLENSVATDKTYVWFMAAGDQ